jgi:hypothetical protein
MSTAGFLQDKRIGHNCPLRLASRAKFLKSSFPRVLAKPQIARPSRCRVERAVGRLHRVLTILELIDALRGHALSNAEAVNEAIHSRQERRRKPLAMSFAIAPQSASPSRSDLPGPMNLPNWPWPSSDTTI